MYELNGWSTYNFPREMERQGVHNVCMRSVVLLEVSDIHINRCLRTCGNCGRSMDQCMTCVRPTLSCSISLPLYRLVVTSTQTLFDTTSQIQLSDLQESAKFRSKVYMLVYKSTVCYDLLLSLCEGSATLSGVGEWGEEELYAALCTAPHWGCWEGLVSSFLH